MVDRRKQSNLAANDDEPSMEDILKSIRKIIADSLSSEVFDESSYNDVKIKEEENSHIQKVSLFSKFDREIVFNMQDLGEMMLSLNIDQQSLNVFLHILSEIADAKAKIGKDEQPEIPTKAPALWSEDKVRGDTPGTFIARHYSQYLGKGLTTGVLDRLDHTLNVAYRRWVEKPDTELPPGFPLPTNKDRLNQRDSEISEEQVREARNLLARAARQKKRNQPQKKDPSRGL